MDLHDGPHTSVEQADIRILKSGSKTSSSKDVSRTFPESLPRNEGPLSVEEDEDDVDDDLSEQNALDEDDGSPTCSENENV